MNKKTISNARHARHVRRSDKIAHGIIWSFAGITLLFLVLIVGFILFNGFYTQEKSAHNVIPQAREAIRLEEGGQEYALMVSKSLSLDEITYDDIREIYMGLNSFWGYLSKQNRKVTLLIESDPLFQEKLSRYFFMEGMPFSRNARYYRSWEELENAFAVDKGVLALVPLDKAESLKNGKILRLQEYSVVVHPEVNDLHDGRRLEKLTGGQLESLLNGDIASWAEIGGPEADTYRITSEKLSEFVISLKNTPGAWGILHRRIVLEQELDILEVFHAKKSLNLKPSFLITPPSRAGAVGGISYIILNTLAMIAFVLLIASPIGVGAAVYLVMYAKQGKWLRLLRLGTDTLAGIPSIIFGLFGLVFFSQFLGLKTGLLSGSLTLTVMILPTIIRTSEEALKSVPRELLEGSMALGATQHQSIMKVIIPKAAPGIITGMILGMGRAIGETAALLFTMGSNLALVRSLNSPMRVLSVHLYMLIRENISLANAFATATILVLIVFLINYATRKLISRGVDY